MDNKKQTRLEEIAGISPNKEKRPIFSEEYITDNKVLNYLEEQKNKEKVKKELISESKKNNQKEVEDFLSEHLNKKNIL